MLVLLTGFELFNRGLYSRAVESVRDEAAVCGRHHSVANCVDTEKTSLG